MEPLTEGLRTRLQYVVLPVRIAWDFPYRALHDAAYVHWRNYWKRVFRNKAPDFLDPLDFCRQDVTSTLFLYGKIAAQNLSTYFHVASSMTPDLEYMKSFLGPAMDVIRSGGAERLMSIEYTSVSPMCGERRVGVRLAEVMNGLALKLGTEHGADATVGTPRTASGLSDVSANYGYRLLGRGLQKAGWVLDVFVGFQEELNDHPDPTYQRLIQDLWQSRIDVSRGPPKGPEEAEILRSLIHMQGNDETGGKSHGNANEELQSSHAEPRR